MKKTLLLSFFLVFALLQTLAQPKHDCYWMMGYSDSSPDSSIWGASVMDFCGDSLQIYEINRPMNFDFTNASMCDSAGNLLFYSNGIYIANRLHQPMLNGTGLLTPGTSGFNEDGIPIQQGVLILPWPGQTQKYFVFYGRLGYFYYNNVLTAGNVSLYYAVVDMSMNNGLGAVTHKNVLITNDTLKMGRLSAVRHANGRDWWLVAGKFHNPELLRFLVTPDGVMNYGSVPDENFVRKGIGQVVFSPDGNYFVDVTLQNWGDNYVSFFEFDRCTGDFFSRGRFGYDDVIAHAGVAISPNSRYAYQTSTYLIRRFDLWADDIPGSMDTAALYDGYEEPIPGFDSLTLPTVFYMAQLAPNGKIYVVSTNTVRSVHVIERPDEEECDVRQHSVIFPKLTRTMPNFPNFRLGALAGSPCDTLGATAVQEPVPGRGIQAYLLPNPARDYFVLALDTQNAALPADAPLRLHLSNSMGQTLRQYQLTAAQREHRISTEELPAGLYYVSIMYGGHLLKTEKLVVVR
ncbi:MAG TPA: T9SS type A sorting domain-containing protein [Saprospiraceae bacterium]|nr:T9SS type A sorting domain-containing protein [Saprospiraceae bacterium]HRK82975.1 T9SS type A sorting domain-containing protein [Saprospiraceae bacterium]